MYLLYLGQFSGFLHWPSNGWRGRGGGCFASVLKFVILGTLSSSTSHAVALFFFFFFPLILVQHFVYQRRESVAMKEKEPWNCICLEKEGVASMSDLDSDTYETLRFFTVLGHELLILALVR